LSDPDDDWLLYRPIPPVKVDPAVDPEDFYNAFRETFLSRARNAESQATLRDFGNLLNSFVLESGGHWRYRQIDATAHDLRAGLFELRHLQYFFTYWGEEDPESWDTEDEQKQHRELWRLSRRTARALKKLGDELEEVVGNWQFKPRRS